MAKERLAEDTRRPGARRYLLLCFAFWRSCVRSRLGRPGWRRYSMGARCLACCAAYCPIAIPPHRVGCVGGICGMQCL